MLQWMQSLLPHIPHYGYVLVFLVVFFNNIGFPLPGETILLGAGFILGRRAESLWPPLAAATMACFLGGICAFWMGRRLGEAGIRKIRWLHLSPDRRKRFDRYFKRHGARTVFFARFIPLFPPVAANLLAGVSNMPWRPFLLYNVTGSAAYSTAYILIGYFFGKKWKAFDAWISPAAPWLAAAGVLVVVLAVIFRRPLSKIRKRLLS